MMVDKLKDSPRLLIEAHLRPIQGERFQPTGFADLGPAMYTLPDKTEMLLVESNQSVANRLEAVCWDDAQDELVSPLQGLPYVRVTTAGKPLTNSILEAHRLNSGYILGGNNSPMLAILKEELAIANEGPINHRHFARVIFKYDPCSILHGLFLSRSDLAGGRLRLQRLLSGFIEARNVRPVESGGVKLDRVNPGGEARQGFGNVPFHRTEFVAEDLRAYMNLDLATLRAYKLGAKAEELLVSLAFWKIQKFLRTNLRLRTACDLHATRVIVTQPEDVQLPELAAFEAKLPALIEACADLFANPRVTIVPYEPVKAKSGKKGAESDEPDTDQIKEDIAS